MSLLLGIDLGSQSAKVVVHDDRGRVVASGRQRLRAPDTSVPGRVEHPGDDLWDATAAACREAVAGLREAGRDPRELAGAGLCGVRFCRALLDADGRLAAPVMSWMDERVSRPHDPARAAATVCAASGHLTRRLTGERRDAAGSYRGQWPVDTERWEWSRDDAVVASYGLRRAQLPALVPPGGVLGTVTAEAAASTGLPAGLPVVATANDKAVEALGGGLTRPDQVLVSLGTYVSAMVTGDHARPDTAAAWTNFGSRPGQWLHESAGVRRGMWTVSWLRELVGGSLPEGPGTLEERLDAAAASVPPGCHGLLTVPDWLAPTDEPQRRGAFVGLDARHGAGHLHRSLLEGTLLSVRDHVAALTSELGRTPTEVLLTGGGGRSGLVRRVAADVLGLPVRAAVEGDSPAALGAAVCAAVGVGVHPGFDDALAAMLPASAVTTADPAAVATYDALAEPLRRLREVLGPVLSEAQTAVGETNP